MRRSFTLVEVLVATVLCGAGLAVACMALAGLVRDEDGAGERVRAARAAERVMARLEGAELDLVAARGNCAAEGEPWLAWEVTVGAGEVQGLNEVQVTIGWDTPAGPRSFTLGRSFFVDPEGAGTLR